MDVIDEARWVEEQIAKIIETDADGSGWSVVRAAVIAAEDRRFYRHPGFDLIGMARALWTFATSGRISGASTIEQQLVRTIRRKYELTLRRKLSEILIAVFVSRKFLKDDLLDAYLRIAYFGWRANGIEQAAKRLSFDLSNLSIQQAAMIASMLKLPMAQHPSKEYSARLKARVDYVLAKLESSVTS